MIYVIDGPHGVGKTTFAKHLLERGVYNGYVHWDAGMVTSQALYAGMSMRLHGMYVFDRWWPSTLAYHLDDYLSDRFKVAVKSAAQCDGITYEIWIDPDDESIEADRFYKVAEKYNLTVCNPFTRQAERQSWIADKN